MEKLEIYDLLPGERDAYETPFIRKAADELAQRGVLIPWLPEPPAGIPWADSQLANLAG